MHSPACKPLLASTQRLMYAMVVSQGLTHFALDSPPETGCELFIFLPLERSHRFVANAFRATALGVICVPVSAGRNSMTLSHFPISPHHNFQWSLFRPIEVIKKCLVARSRRQDWEHTVRFLRLLPLKATDTRQNLA